MFAFVYYMSFPELKHKKIIFYLLLAVLFSACAKIGVISGGDTDTIPPFLIKSIPINYATNFTGKKIRISFNEFIDLKDLTKEYLVSPPLSKLPEVKNINKDLIIEPLDSLLANTTYTLSFGNSVVDFTAGNPVKNFEFVFSTGNEVDSLSVQGRLLNAFDLSPFKEQVYVMLYSNLSDSAPYRKLPAYICRTDLLGRYRLDNLKEGNYRLFALKDGNSNMKFDLVSESIAFDDSAFHLKPEPIKDILELFPDTARKINANKSPKAGKGKIFKSKQVIHKDTLRIDSLKLIPKKKYGEIKSLFMFQELGTRQYLKEYKRISKEVILLVMNLPVRKQDTIFMEMLDTIPYKSWILAENHIIGDSIDYWITDTNLVRKEDLKVALKLPVSDSTGNIYLKKDTLDFKFISKEPKKKKQEKPVRPKLGLKMNASSGGLFDLNHQIEIEADKPIQSFNPSYIELYKMDDTIARTVKFTIKKDSLNIRKFHISNKWDESTDYRLKIFPAAFKDIYGINADTTLIRFKTQKADYYGKFILTLDSVSMNIVVQIMQKDKPIAQKHINHKGQLVFDYLIPGKYKIKYIFDRNGNNKWDTGNYLKKLQPEKVKFWWREEDLRSGFDVELQINCKD
jgi:uncharacterized protein (DUF2141 family)